MTDQLEVNDHGRLRVLRLNRPERKNALSRELLGALNRVFRDAAADDDVWAVLITGNGDAFCSGIDLADPVMGDAPAAGDGDTPASAPKMREHLTDLMRVQCEKPILAGVNGVAVGAGLSLAMNADIRIAGPSARFHPGYTRIGINPDLGLTWTLPRAIGYERAMRFLLELRMVAANEALAIGLVSEVVERDEDLEARLMEYGQMLANVAPIAARQTKRLLYEVERPADLVGQLDEEIALVTQALRTKDSAEAIRAMMAGEKPDFTGT
jgi:2-(1,2-epoxy-1,2-dihydrophenyl)acetyl-CoA isomerase